MVLDTCVAFFQHAVPVALAFEGTFIQPLAAFVEARKRKRRDLPTKPICLRIAAIAYFAFLTATTAFDNKWDDEKAF